MHITLKLYMFLITNTDDCSVNSFVTVVPVSGWMIWTFWTRYKANPTRSVIEYFQAPIYLIPFPAITLCPLVSPLWRRRQEMLERLRLPHNMSNETANFLVRYVRYATHMHIGYTQFPTRKTKKQVITSITRSLRVPTTLSQYTRANV